MKHGHVEQGWVMPIALIGLAVVSALATSAWRQAQHSTEGLGYLKQHERSRQMAHAQLSKGESAWRRGDPLPSELQYRTMLSADLGWPPPHWQLHRFIATGTHGDSRVVLESTWVQALDEHGQPRRDTPPERWSWRELWP
jgi:hypothetical protein